LIRAVDSVPFGFRVRNHLGFDLQDVVLKIMRLRLLRILVITGCCLLKAQAQEIIHFTAAGQFPLSASRMTLEGNMLTYSFTHTGALEYYDIGILMFLNSRPLGSCVLSFSGPESCAIQGVVMLSDQEVANMVIGTSSLGVILNYAPTDEYGVLRGEWFRVQVYRVPDSDGDGLPDYLDHCTDTPLGALVDENGCSMEQLCPCNGPWKNRGEYLKSLRAVTADFLNADLITETERHLLLTEAAKSDCGKR
jgi:hypothetical protein